MTHFFSNESVDEVLLLRVKELKLSNFRVINELFVNFECTQTTVFVGVNGSGKTSILDCLAILLSRLIGRIESTQGTGRFFTDDDISNGRTETFNEITITYLDRDFSFRVAKTRKGREQKKQTNLNEIRGLAKEIRENLEVDIFKSLPLVVFYPVNRAVFDIPIRIKQKHTFDQLAAYEGALVGGPRDFRLFFEWFREREDLENEIRIERRHKIDPHLEAVRKAVSSLLPGFSNLRIRRSPLRMTLEKQSKELIVNQLSDGEKCLLALAGDLARRLAIANPSLPDPLLGKATVLIDEIELHLHPSWQRKIIPALESTFPHCQFIVSTHSPLVLSHVKPEGVNLLQSTNDGLELRRINSSYGLDTNLILEEIMGVSERPEEIKNKLRSYFYQIDKNNFSEAMQLRNELEKEIGPDEPEFARADILLRRKRILDK